MKRQYHADFVVVNGENAAVVGITPNQADSILDAGADIITMGNHTWSKREIVPYMDDCPWIIRPANYAPQVPGRGWQIVQTAVGDVAVDFDRTVYDDEETDDAYYAEDYIADRKSQKKQRKKGSGGLVLLLLGEMAGIAGIIWWWIKWLS